MLVVVDLGNTRIKFGAFEDGRLVATERLEGGVPIAHGMIPFPHVAGADEVVVVSSAPAHLPELLAALGRPARVLGEDVQRGLDTTYADPRQLGVDRLAAAFGARELVGGGPVVAVDTGTATTVDALDRAGRFVAVAIGPGLGSAAEGLRLAAPHLPPVRAPDGDVPLPARSTDASLAAGFVLGVAGLVERLAAEARRLLEEDAPVVLTGGGARVVSSHLRMTHRLEPEAVLHGIRVLHRLVPV